MFTSTVIENPSQLTDDSIASSNTTQLYTMNQEPQFQHGDEYRDLLTILFDDEVSSTGFANQDNQQSQDLDVMLVPVHSPSSSDMDVSFGIVDSLTLVDSKHLVSKILESEDSEDEFHDTDENRRKEDNSNDEKMSRSPSYYRRNGVRRNKGHFSLDLYTFVVPTNN